jgi:hypothetical protein
VSQLHVIGSDVKPLVLTPRGAVFHSRLNLWLDADYIDKAKHAPKSADAFRTGAIEMTNPDQRLAEVWTLAAWARPRNVPNKRKNMDAHSPDKKAIR